MPRPTPSACRRSNLIDHQHSQRRILMSKVALVTGANKGVGFEKARQLAAGGGVYVLLAARDRGKGVEAALRLQAQGLDVEALTLDVTDTASIGAAAREVEEKFGRLDILIN